MARLTPILVTLILLMVPASAQAGVARMDSEALRYTAYGGEVNDVTVSVESEQSLLITDATGRVDVGERCTKLSDHQARCSARAGRELFRFQHQVFLQDGDDKARGPATLHGGPGNDEIVDEIGSNWSPQTGWGFANSSGDDGNDTVVGAGQGNEGNDLLRALPGEHAILIGGVGDDRLEGSTGNDLFMPGPGSDHVASGGGRDALTFEHFQNPSSNDPLPAVTFSLEPAPQGGRAGENATYEGTFVEVHVGSSPGSIVTGNDLGNRLSGLGTLRGLGGDDELIAGTDRLEGNVQTDERLEGGEGDDLLHGGTGGDRDELDGGPGDDRIDAFDDGDVEGDRAGRGIAATADAIACGAGKDRIDIDTEDPRPSDCEIVALLESLRTTVTGTNGSDVLPGFNQTDSTDRIFGRGGNDIIEGLHGPDVLYGQDGNDRLVGESADPGRAFLDEADTLSGGSGADHLIGGFGADRITGGSGSDRVSAGDGNDRIGVRDGRRDKVRCGRGRDRVIADRGDRVAGDCEVVSRR